MKSSRFLSWTFLMGLLFVGATLAACNTVEGIGRDVEEAGDAIEDAADDD